MKCPQLSPSLKESNRPIRTCTSSLSRAGNSLKCIDPRSQPTSLHTSPQIHKSALEAAPYIVGMTLAVILGVGWCLALPFSFIICPTMLQSSKDNLSQESHHIEYQPTKRQPHRQQHIQPPRHSPI